MKMMKHTISSNLEFGKIYTAFVYFNVSETKGKPRPVILFRNQADENITAFQVSSKLNSPFNKKYGYIIVDWKETGLKNSSVANLHPKDLLELKSSDLKTVVGELSDRDKIGLLEKYTSIIKNI